MALNNTENHDNEKLIMSFLNNELDDSDKLIFVNRIGEDPNLAKEVASLQKTWSLLDDVPVPGPSQAMNDQFNAMLLSFKNETQQKSAQSLVSLVIEFLQNMWPNHLAAKSLMAAMMTLVTFFSGYWLSTSKNYHQLIAQQEHKINGLQTDMMLALIEKKSPVERLKAVSISQEIKENNSQIIEALLKTLKEDENDNVRLASLEALIPFVGDANVRLGLVESIRFQPSPLVQMALADVMVSLQEKRSIDALKELIENENTPNEIKDKIQESINVLI